MSHKFGRTVSKLRVRYVNCSINDKHPDSFMSRLIADSVNMELEIVADRNSLVDLQVTSVQLPNATRVRQMLERVAARRLPAFVGSRDSRWADDNPSPNGKAEAHLWFTGENTRPPSNTGWDGTLSFDVDSFGGKNAYCPLWWNSIGIYGPATSTFMTPAPSIESLIGLRARVKRRPGFAVAFINNPHPVRFHAINALRSIGDVQVFGNAVGRPIPNKAHVAANFRFVLCFENDLYPGYVTEKPIEAWATGAIPLWWGNDVAEYLNPTAIINAANFRSFSHFAEEVSRIDGDDELRSEMSAQPLILKSPDLTPAKRVIRKALGMSNLVNDI